jgi:hypothetical protein
MGQQATTLHFGLGAEDRVESIEVRWQSGTLRTLLNPAVDRYHPVLSYDGAAAGSSQAADG